MFNRDTKKIVTSVIVTGVFIVGIGLISAASPVPAPHVAYAGFGDQIAQTAGNIWHGITSFFGGAADAFTKFFTDITASVIAGIGVLITAVVIAILTPFVWIAGQVFEWVIQNFVIGMGVWISGPQAAGVKAGWVLLRDVANIGIIAGLVATAVGTIIRSGTYNVNKNLARIIIAALLVNFSFFFAGVIVDASNLTTNILYKQLISGGWCINPAGFASGSGGTTCTISDRFIKIIEFRNFDFSQITSAQGTSNPGQVADQIANTTVSMLFGNLMIIVFQLAIAYVLISVATLFIARYIVIILLLVSSPIGIAGAAIPILSSYAKEWWKSMLTQAIFAPLYVLFAGISLHIIELSNAALLGGGVVGQGSASTVTSSMASTLVTYIIAIGFMIASLRVAKGLSAQASRFADIYKYADQYFGKPVSGFLSNMNLGRIPFTNIPIGGPGFLAQRAKFAYEKMAPKVADGRLPVPKWFPGGEKGWKVMPASAGRALDRNIAKGIELARGFKFGGGQSATELEKERIARGAEVGQLTKREELLEQAQRETMPGFAKADAGYKERRKNGWDAPTKAEQDEAEALGGDEEKIKAFNDREDRKDKRKWKWDKDQKKWRYESRWEYDERIKNDKDEHGESWYDHYNALKDNFRELGPGAAKELFHDNPRLLVEYAELWTPDQFLEIMKDTEIPRGLKREMRDKRQSTALALVRENAYGKEGTNFASAKWESGKGGRVIELSVWDKMSKDDKDRAKANGWIGEFSDEWYDARSHMHESFKRQIDKDEMVDLVTSTTGIKNGLQDNQMFLDAITNGNKMALQENEKLGAGNRRRMRGLYRKRFKSAMDLDDAATQTFEKANVSEADRKAMAAAISDGVSDLDDDQFKSRIAELEKQGVSAEKLKELARGREEYRKQNEDVKKAAQDRATADARAGRWFQGKAPSEVQTEMKQEYLGHRVIAENIEVNQLAQLDKDQVFMTQLRNAILVHGNRSGAQEWIAVNPNGQSKYGLPADKELEEINKRRVALGLDPFNRDINQTTGEPILVTTPSGSTSSSPSTAGAGETTASAGPREMIIRIINDPALTSDQKKAQIAPHVAKLTVDEIANMPPDTIMTVEYAQNLTLREVQGILSTLDRYPRDVRIAILNTLAKHTDSKVRDAVSDYRAKHNE